MEKRDARSVTSLAMRLNPVQGTLQDLRLGDLLALLGQQRRSGQLTLKRGALGITMQLVDGNMVDANSSTRSGRSLLGTVLGRAGLATEAQLISAEAAASKSGLAVGDVLVASDVLQREVLNTMRQALIHSVVGKAFLWTQGDFRFTSITSKDDEAVPDVAISGEVLGMDAARQSDEWKLVRRTVVSYAQTVRQARPLPIIERVRGGPAPDEDVGALERRLYRLITTAGTLQQLIDQARVAEFDVVRGVVTLIAKKFVVSPVTAPVLGLGLAEYGALEPAAAQAPPPSKGWLSRILG